MNEFELVVARYAEDLKWMRRVPEAYKASVYNKGWPIDGAISLENFGYEAHTYLHHIVSRYDSLADTTVFVQGHPFDHAPSLHRLLGQLVSGERKVKAFRWLGFVADYDDSSGQRLFQTWSKNRDQRTLDLEGFCWALWDEPATERFVFYPGGQFIARADLIRSQPLSFYRKALDLSVSFADAGHCFERTWDRVFGCNGLPESLRERELPIYFRPIRRLGTTWDDVPEEERGW